MGLGPGGAGSTGGQANDGGAGVGGMGDGGQGAMGQGQGMDGQYGGNMSDAEKGVHAQFAIGVATMNPIAIGRAISKANKLGLLNGTGGGTSGMGGDNMMTKALNNPETQAALRELGFTESDLTGGGSSGDAMASAYMHGAELQAEQMQKALELQERIYNQTRQDYEPWRKTGVWALGKMKSGIQSGEFDPGEFNFEFTNDDPSYQFRFDEGVRALDNSAAARGRLNSGAQGRSLTRYGQDMASTEYQNAFGRYLTKWNADRARGTDKFNRFAGLSGSGQSATGAVANAGANYAGNATSAYGQIGTALNQGTVGAENARYSAYRDSVNDGFRQQEIDRGIANDAASIRSADRASRNNLWSTGLGLYAGYGTSTGNWGLGIF